MLAKRIIPCLDVKHGRVTKGVRFEGNRDVGDPVELGRRYAESGADELVFYDIGASPEGKGILLDWVSKVAEQVFIPFSVGGGIRTVEDMRAVLLAGAEKVSINTAAVQNPDLIRAGAQAFGSQCVVVGMDVRRNSKSPIQNSQFEVVIKGGREATAWDAVAWAREVERLGAGEICLNSIDADGTKDGYDLELTRVISSAVGIPVIASGGAGSVQDVVEVFAHTEVDAALLASILHFGQTTIGEVKQVLDEAGIAVRPFT